jgi:hypothetical protein
MRKTMKHYEFEISLLLDNELPDIEKKELFTHLAECKECSNVFTELLSTKEKIGNGIVNGILNGLPELNKSLTINTERSLSGRLKHGSIYKIPFYISAVAAAILFFIVISNKDNIEYVKNTVVKKDTVFVEMEKNIITAKAVKGRIEKKVNNKLPNYAENSGYISYVMNLPAEKMTKENRIY